MTRAAPDCFLAELAKLLISAQGSLPQVEQKVLALISNSQIPSLKIRRWCLGLWRTSQAIRNSIQSTNDALAASHKKRRANYRARRQDEAAGNCIRQGAVGRA